MLRLGSALILLCLVAVSEEFNGHDYYNDRYSIGYTDGKDFVL